MHYRFSSTWLVILDALLLGRRMERESQDALFRAKQFLEKSKIRAAEKVSALAEAGTPSAGASGGTR